jgi:hypothetical protein
MNHIAGRRRFPEKRSPQVSLVQKSRQRGVKLIGIVVGLILTSAATYFLPGLWRATTDVVVSPERLSVQVLMPDEFEAHIEGHREGGIWPMAVKNLPLGAMDYQLDGDDYIAGAVDAPNTLIRLVLKGTSPEKIVIHDWKVDVIQRHQPLHGVHVADHPSQPVPARNLSVDLNTQKLQWYDDSEKPIRPMILAVNDSEVEIVDVLANANGCGDCYWVMRLTYTAGSGEPYTKVIRPPERMANGRMEFRTSSLENASTYIPSGKLCVDPPGVKPLCPSHR